MVFKLPDAEALRLLSSSGFLSIKELGKFLLLTSKNMTEGIYTGDEVWNLLFQSRFSFTTMPNNSKQAFLLYTMKEKRRPNIPIHKLRFNPGDYRIIINIFQHKGGKAVYSACLNGAEHKEFFASGTISLKNLNIKVNTQKELGNNLVATLHIHRIPDDKVTCLFHCSEIDWEEDDDEERIWFFDSDGLEMRDLVYSRRLGEELSSIGESIDGLTMEIDLKICYQHDMSEDENLTDLSCLCDCRQRFIKELVLITYTKNYYDFNEFPLNSKATFAHYLEELYGWEN